MEIILLVLVLALAVALGLWIFANPIILVVAVVIVLALLLLFWLASFAPQPSEQELDAVADVLDLLGRLKRSYDSPNVRIITDSASIDLVSSRDRTPSLKLYLWAEDSGGFEVSSSTIRGFRVATVKESFGTIEELESWLRQKLERHTDDPTDPWNTMTGSPFSST